MVPDGKNLGSIHNADNVSPFLWQTSGRKTTVDEFKGVVVSMLKAKPKVLALRVGWPDPVAFSTEVGTTIDKHMYDVAPNPPWKIISGCMTRLLELGTDPLALASEACREYDVLIVASFRMNDNHLGQNQYLAHEFGRQHPQWRIAGTGLMDPAVPEVFEHRMKLFREVAQNYDIDGIEFDFMRWNHMIAKPRNNHPLLTKMVTQTHDMLHEVAKQKGRNKLLLGVRVPPSLETEPNEVKYPGMAHSEANRSCKDKGLDVITWIKNGDVAYVCPSLYWPHWPGLPHTKEFTKLARETDVGIYPTLFPVPDWVHGSEGKPIDRDDHERLLRYKNEFCHLALQLYEDGADGISTYNWAGTCQPGMVPYPQRNRPNWGDGAKQVQWVMHSKIASPDALRQYLARQTSLLAP